MNIHGDGMLADETSQIRLVGFQGFQQRKQNEYYQKNISVKLSNFEVAKFDIATASKAVTLSSLESLDDFQKVTVNLII